MADYNKLTVNILTQQVGSVPLICVTVNPVILLGLYGSNDSTAVM